LQRVGGNRQAQELVLNELSVGGGTRFEGRINVNTASETVLNSIPGMVPDVAAAIVSRQANGGFTRLSEILEIPGMAGTVLNQAAGALSVSSTTFIVRVQGVAGRTRVYREATVEMVDNLPVLRSVQSPPFAEMSARWGWEEEPSGETVIREDS
jgi:hypothetical protein